jgi:hypothetical protein
VELDDGRRVLLVVARPARENLGALSRHCRETGLETLQRILRVTEVLEGDGDLFDLDLKVRRAWFDRSLAIWWASLVHRTR